MATYTLRLWSIHRKVTNLPSERQDMTRKSYASERPGLTFKELQLMLQRSFAVEGDWDFIELKITKEGE